MPIKEDPHERSNNGKILADILEWHNLTVLNSLDVCSGTITRERVADDKLEQSVIDYIIVCDSMLKHVKSMTVDEERTHVLTRYLKTKNVRKTVPSDHNVLVGKFDITFSRQNKAIRKQVFQYKNIENKTKFLQETSSDNTMSSCFHKEVDFKSAANYF